VDKTIQNLSSKPIEFDTVWSNQLWEFWPQGGPWK